jgi:serine/threonine protein kinase
VATLPDFVPGYELLAELGRGTSGVVYKARRQLIRPGELVAIKYPEFALERERNTSISQIASEVRILSLLTNGANGPPDPDIPRLHAVSDLQGHTCFVREYIEGTTLSDLVSRNAIGLRELVGILATVAGALGRLHTLGAAHRNLDPSNVLVATGGAAKLIGFGRAYSLVPAGTPLAETSDATVQADLARLQRLLAFCCNLLRQPPVPPPRLQALCQGSPVPSAAEFAGELEGCRELLP